MPRLEEALDAAASERIIDPAQVAGLAEFLAARGIVHRSERAGSTAGPADAPTAGSDATTARLEDSELPRFVRGFHDILITIGVAAASIGLGFTLGPLAVMAAAWGLAEFLVRRQRLALPAFSLTVVWGTAAVAAYIDYAKPVLGDLIGDPRDVGIWAALVLSLVLFHARFRVPFALATTILAAGGFSWVSSLTLTFSADSLELLLLGLSPSFTIVAFLHAAALFAVALWFDWRDLERRTRRSDVAFWLHLAAAPALLYATTLLVMTLFGAQTTQLNFWESVTVYVLPIVVLLMLVGVLIDRRAFVTAGLVSLGSAVGYFLEDVNINATSTIGIALLVVGVVVLLLGTNWQGLRRIVLGLLPERWRAVFRPA